MYLHEIVFYAYFEILFFNRVVRQLALSIGSV